MNILIVEDEIIIAQHLQEICEEIGHRVVGIVPKPEKLLDALTQFAPEAVLLDINLDGKFEGIEIGKMLSEQYALPYLFITSYSDKQLMEKAISSRPEAYIIKPFQEAEIFAALKIIEQKIKLTKAETYYPVTKNYKQINLPYSEILYIQSDGNYVKIFSTRGLFMERVSLEKTLGKLNCADFARIHRSYIVNKNHISARSSASVFLGETELPVSKTYKSNV